MHIKCAWCLCILNQKAYTVVMDHTNYARSLPVHVRDMVQLPDKHPGVYAECLRGNLAVLVSYHHFHLSIYNRLHAAIPPAPPLAVSYSPIAGPLGFELLWAPRHPPPPKRLHVPLLLVDPCSLWALRLQPGQPYG